VVDLDVSDNPRLGAAGTEALCVVLPPSFAAEGTAGLRTLSLSGCGCGPGGAIALGTALELNTSLTR